VPGVKSIGMPLAGDTMLLVLSRPQVGHSPPPASGVGEGDASFSAEAQRGAVRERRASRRMAAEEGRVMARAKVTGFDGVERCSDGASIVRNDGEIVDVDAFLAL